MASGIATTFTQKRSQILPRIASVVKPALGNVSVKRPIPGQLDPVVSEALICGQYDRVCNDAYEQAGIVETLD